LTPFDVQVTRGKTGLDKALKLAKKLKKEMASVREMLHSVEEIDAKEGVEGPRNLEKELQWVKVESLFSLTQTLSYPNQDVYFTCNHFR